MCYNYIRIKMVFEVEIVLLSHPCGYKEMREGAHPPNTITRPEKDGFFASAYYKTPCWGSRELSYRLENAEVSEDLLHFVHIHSTIE